MTTRKKPGAKKPSAKKPAAKKVTKPKVAKPTARVKRKAPARSGPIRSGQKLPKSGETVGMSPKAHADANVDEGMINQAVADAVRNANKVFSDTVAQGRVAAEQFRHGEYNMRDVPVDVQIMGQRMIRLARELSDTTLNILEQLLKQMTDLPSTPPKGLNGSVPPFPTGGGEGSAHGGSSAAPPSSHPAPTSKPDNTLQLTVQFKGNKKAKALPSPLWKPAKPTLPSQLAITPMLPTHGKATPLTQVTFEADLSGQLIVTVDIPAKQPAGVYAGMVVPDNTDVPLGILTIEIVK